MSSQDVTDKYYATYCRLNARCDDVEIKLDGNMVQIGKQLCLTEQTHINQRNKHKKCVEVSLDERTSIGFLPEKIAQRLISYFDKGWTCHAACSLVVYDKLEECYWAELAIICYAPDVKEAFDSFAPAMFERIAQGRHPKLTLTQKQFTRVLESKGAWCETAVQNLPSLKTGSAVYKRRRTKTEELAMRAANNTRGCYARASFALVLLVIIIIIVFKAMG